MTDTNDRRNSWKRGRLLLITKCKPIRVVQTYQSSVSHSQSGLAHPNEHDIINRLHNERYVLPSEKSAITSASHGTVLFIPMTSATGRELMKRYYSISSTIRTWIRLHGLGSTQVLQNMNYAQIYYLYERY